jgi:endo-1,4-beta-D-glucanase Y
VREPFVWVLALALAVAAVLFAVGCGGDDDDSADGSTTPTVTRPADAAAERFLDRYMTADGRVQRIDEGGDTVGEGQAYGMLLAAAIGDEGRFDVIWDWTKANMRRPDGLISFLWRDGRVVDPEAASDADVDAARALLVAACRFKRPDFRREALELAEAILTHETTSFQGAPVLTAGPWARSDPITLNPSYFSPATFAQLGTATGDGQWGSLSASSRSVTQTLMPDPGSLPPDWASVQGDTPVPSGPPADPDAPPRYGFDAPRTLVRMAEDPDPAGREIAAGAWPAFDGRDPADIPVEHDLSGEPAGGTLHPMALVAAAAAADAAGQAAAKRRLLDAAEDLDRQTPTYYGAAWVALGRVMLDTNELDACP